MSQPEAAERAEARAREATVPLGDRIAAFGPNNGALYLLTGVCLGSGEKESWRASPCA